MIDIAAVVIAVMTVVGGVLAFVVKRVIDHVIGYHVAKLKESFTAELKDVGRIRDILMDSRIRAHREVSNLVYRSRNVARELRNNVGSSNASVTELGGVIHDLTMILYSIRFDVTTASFESVHQYKVLLIEFHRVIESPLTSKEPSEREIGGYSAQLDKLFHEINGAHERILTQLRIEVPELGERNQDTK